MLLNELFDEDSTKAVYLKSKRRGIFKIGEDTYTVIFKFDNNSNDDNVESKDVTVDFVDSKGTFNDTGKHQALKVLSKVFTLVHKMIAAESPNTVRFTSENKRARIYRRWAEKAFPGQVRTDGRYTVIVFGEKPDVDIPDNRLEHFVTNADAYLQKLKGKLQDIYDTSDDREFQSSANLILMHINNIEEEIDLITSEENTGPNAANRIKDSLKTVQSMYSKLLRNMD